MSSEQVKSEGNAAEPRGAAKQDVLSVLSEFELGLESLKTLYKQRQELQGQLEAREAEVSKREQAAARSSEEIQGLIAKFEQDRKGFDARAAEVETGRKHLEEERQDFDQEAERRLGEIESKRRAVEEESKALTAHAEQIAGQLEDIARRENELASEREKLSAERRSAESLRGAVASKDAELVRRDTQLRALGEAVTQLRKDLAAAEELRDEITGREEQLRSEIKQLREQASAKGGESSERERQLESLITQLRSRIETTIAEQEKREKQLQATIDELKAQLEQAAGEGAESDETRRLRDGLAAAKQELKSAGEHARALDAALREARAGKGDAGGASSEEWVLRRKARLGQYRTALRRQSEKVRKASDALKKRYEQCEQVLSMRAELFVIRERVVEAERRAQRRRSTTTAAVIMFCIVGTLAIVGTLSWAISRQVVPATFEATSVLEADGRGRELNEAELDEWVRFHQQLLNDPIFHADAAERFKRQGLADLGDPGVIAKLIKESLKTETLRDGTLTMRLREEGASRTERDLDILTASLAAEANAQQQRRVDGGVTKVKQSAKAGADPVDQTQNIYALVMTGVGALVSGLIGVLTWGRLSRAKSAFEMDNQINESLNSPKFAKIS